MTAYSDEMIEKFYNDRREFYLSFWDDRGSLHCGYFERDNPSDSLKAYRRTNEIMADRARIGADSHVLDVCCGMGSTLLSLAERLSFQGVGVDLTTKHVEFANAQLDEKNRELTTRGLAPLRLSYQKGNAMELPFKDEMFTHVISQTALFSVTDKPRSHREIFRVLRKRGVFAFDDFLQPKEKVSAESRRDVYDRVLWQSGYSFAGYQEALKECGFRIEHADERSQHIRTTYFLLGELTREKASKGNAGPMSERYQAYSKACEGIVAAIDRGEFSWGFFVAVKD